ncbi:preprotein translocase subunit SecG [candidate division WOR-3 bacterium]|nr:preprotein translocase subunit SecG [candidate division WOR-3 bacterium]
MFTIFLPIHIIVAILLILIVLLQQSKGGGLSPVLGGGQSVFGARGAASFLTKMTAVLAILFMITSIILAISPRFRTSMGDIEDQLKKDLIPTETAPQIPKEGTEIPPAPEGGGE